jgi:hypothetical protein
MIAWRTSRFLLLFFLLISSVLTIAAVVMADQAVLVSWRDYVLALRPGTVASPSPVQTVTTAVPTPVVDEGQAALLPRYPAVQITPPAVSIFDPAA